jgi:hypothetical protein
MRASYLLADRISPALYPERKLRSGGHDWKGQGARDAAGIAGPLSPDRYYDRLPQDEFTQGALGLTVQGFVADPSRAKGTA